MWIIAIASLLLIVIALVAGKWDPVTERMESLSGDGARGGGPAASPPAAAARRAAPASRTGNDANATFHERLMHAGIYRSYSVGLLVAIRLVSFVLPFGMGLVFARLGMIAPPMALLLGATVGGVGIIAPSFWLDHLKSKRQTMMRRALPDALDTIIVCLEGGLSLNAAFARVGTELAGAHPMLSLELKIVEREVRVGRSTGEAVRSMAQRFDLEELRSLASVIQQAEKFGSSVTTAMNVFATSLRLRRQQHAEAMAHKASVKMMFPTVFCILPALFVVLLGPAVMRVMDTLLPIMNRGN